MSNFVAAPQCFAEIYPFEGGQFQITGAQIVECTVSKMLRGDGTFTLVLAPGGPLGVNVPPSWAQVLTPMSLCLIGMSRWIYSEIVMVGVVRNIREKQVWTADGVQRLIIITGEDFGWFFKSFNWCSLSFLAGAGAAAIGDASTGNENAGLPAILAGSLLSGTPDQVAQAWYTKIMAGTEGILSQTQLAYGQSSVGFPEAMGTLFEPYPGFTIPFGDSFVSDEGSWMSKFQQILAFPWYEFFIATVPNGFYPTEGGFGFTMRALPDSIVSPVAIGRINPVPVISTSGAGQSMTFNGIDTSKWEALVEFLPDSGFIESTVEFNADDVRNFYILNPIWSRLLLGQSNTALMPYVLQFVGAFDADSIHRYGYHPEYATTRWMSDLQGSAPLSNDDFNNLCADLTSRVFSYYHPTPLMACADVVYPLRPDILAGNRFTYTPFKADEDWEFYIEGFEHHYIFGGDSTTTLKLSRGLPSAIYAAGGDIGSILAMIHLGVAQRSNGTYEPSLTGTGLQSFGITDANNVASQIAQVYVAAQKQ